MPLALRHEQPDLTDPDLADTKVAYDERARWIAFRRGDVRVAVNLSESPAAIPLARHLGARDTAAAGTSAKHELARGLGAERTVVYEEIAELRDVDVAFDPVGGPVFTSCLASLRPLGVAVGIGFAGGAWEPVDPARLVGRNVGVLGFYLGRLMGLDPRVVREAVAELLALWRDGAIRPVVGAEFPLADAAAAHELIGSRRSTGKVVLIV